MESTLTTDHGPRTTDHSWRLHAIVTLVGLAWLVLAGRLVQLQWLQRDDLASRAERQRVWVEPISARPGDLFDREGRLLATTVRKRSLFVVPSRIRDPELLAKSIAGALGLDEAWVRQQAEPDPERHFAWIKRRLSTAEVEQIRALDLPARTWGFRDEYQREYPQGPLATQVLGLRDIDGVGRGGVEQGLDDLLRGQNGSRQLLRDARGRVMDREDDEFFPPRHGQDVTLALDSVIQLFTERELDQIMTTWQPESCCALVMDPTSGDVLAMASRPTFDPNHPEQATDAAWTNRTIADIYEPGSTFKPFVVAYGLEHGLIHRDDQFNCEWGEYRMGRRVLHDHHRYGTLNLTDVLVKSSNIGMAKVGEKLGNDNLYAAAVQFGFGRKTGIELPGEQPGVLRPLEKWTSYSTGSIPMGHELATTPLQLLTAHCALANGGTLLQPRLVLHETASRVTDSATSVPPVPVSGRLVQQTVSAETAHWLIEVPMQEVVTRGTGKRARIPGYHVFGKTGTAQSLSPQGGYQSGKYISSFVCGGPVEHPRLLVLVVVNQASVGSESFGGKVAAPAAAEILKQSLVYLRISPDQKLIQEARAWRDEVLE